MRALALTLVLLITAAAPGQNPAQKQEQKPALFRWNISRKDVDLLLKTVPQSDALRFAQLKQSFSDFECKGPQLRDQSFPKGKNLICAFPGIEPASKPVAPGIVLFIAHYEHEGAGQSAIDNWSGAIMLPFLYHAIFNTSRIHSFIFAEVDGVAGAKAFFDSLTATQRHSLEGVVALDALGLGPAQYYISSNDIKPADLDSSLAMRWSWLQQRLFQAATDHQPNAPLMAIPGSWYKVDITRDFRYHAIPSILIHSVNWNTRQLPGSTRDTVAAINGDTYFNTYNLLADYMVELDKPQPSAIQAAPSSSSRGARR